MLRNRHKFNKNECGIEPLTLAIIIGGIALVGAVGAVAYFGQPDVTYNISEGGLFSIAGLELSGLEVIAIIVGIIFVIAFLFKRK